MRQIAVLLLTVAFVWSSVAVVLRAEESSEKENGDLAEALESVKVSLDDGLQASEEAQGTPISGKFEMDDGKLQLSVYTMKDGKFFEVIVDHKTGKVAKAEPITRDDLTAAKAQAEAMAKAKSSLHIVASKAVADNSGSQAVNITPSLKEGHPVAEVILVKNDHFNKISSPLD
jgi:hypothetical protein